MTDNPTFAEKAGLVLLLAGLTACIVYLFAGGGG